MTELETSVPRAWPSWASLTLPGAWGALLLAAVSFSPSLLPRGPITQGVVAGISAAIGVGLGVLVAWVTRAFTDEPARHGSPRSWRVFVVSAVVLGVAAIVLGHVWQSRVRALMDIPTLPALRLALVPLVAVLVLVVVVGIARGLRRLAAWLSTLLARRVGPRAARALGGIIVAVAAILLVSDVLLDGFVTVADRAFSVRDQSTDEGVTAPVSPLRSGSSASVLDWDTLGRQGRNFVTRGPSAAEIAQVRSGDAQEPIRIYAGLASAANAEDRARLAVDDLERAGGFERGRLLVATTTGTGWLEPGTMASFEHVSMGDTAIVAMQYSYLPSWISFLVDQPRAREAGRELFDAVYERWAQLPAEARPELLVFGESLGSFGAEAAFSGEFDLRNRTAGALLVGPPASNLLHAEFTDNRDGGSTQIEPVYREGRAVRFSQDIAAGAPPRDGAWDGTRVLYLQHPSDPIVWWDPDLLLRRPDWLREPRGRDVLDGMRWFPFVTFWQVTLDMPFAVEVPDGHGHRYAAESVAAWATVLRPPDWTDADADRVRAAIAE
jgi:uncharacterized membrane protein